MTTIDYNMTILIVDDSLSMRKVVRRFLLNNGFSRFLEAGNGQQAYEIIQKQAVDLIICDLNMPVMDGMALLEMVKSDPFTRRIPFIILTVEAIQATMNQAIALDVDSYIVKPVEEKVFINEMIRVIRSSGDNSVTLL